MLNHPCSAEILPDVPAEPFLAQPEAVSSPPVLDPWEQILTPTCTLLWVVFPPFLQAQPPQLLLTRFPLWTLPQLCWHSFPRCLWLLKLRLSPAQGLCRASVTPGGAACPKWPLLCCHSQVSTDLKHKTFWPHLLLPAPSTFLLLSLAAPSVTFPALFNMNVKLVRFALSPGGQNPLLLKSKAL